MLGQKLTLLDEVLPWTVVKMPGLCLTVSTTPSLGHQAFEPILGLKLISNHHITMWDVERGTLGLINMGSDQR